MKRFEDLVVYQRAIKLMLVVYAVTKDFPPEERYGVTSQIRRASFSVMRHLAEGQGRLSLGEWRQFLNQARGSLYEIQSDCIGSMELGYLSEDDSERVRDAVRDTAKPLAGLIKYVTKRERERRQPTTNNPPPT